MSEIVTFVKISAELLDQKLPYNEILTLLMNDTENKTLRDTLKEVNNDLKKGADSEATFLKYQHVVNNHFLLKIQHPLPNHNHFQRPILRHFVIH